jgi:hypothetical protein
MSRPWRDTHKKARVIHTDAWGRKKRSTLNWKTA